ncbi:MAG: tyrosine-specific transport protein [Gammaproteobacteria bacterium]|nr:tyrosine-specific transport protein [Gammaproteobacteria bacterium]
MGHSKFIGSLLIVVGTSIGAGILALPLVSAHVGWVFAIGLLLLIWSLMTVTGLLVLEVNLSLEARSSGFSSMAEKTLGYPGKIVAWLTCILLLYALTAAYISGASSLLKELFYYCFSINVPSFVNAILFVAILGGAVFWSTKATDFLNRGMISIKGFLLFMTIAFLMPHIDVASAINNNVGAVDASYIYAVFPIFICSFGYHTVIPSIRMYFGNESSGLRKIIVLGTTTSLVIYIVWVFVVLNIIPLNGDNSFEQIFAQNTSVGGLVGAVTAIVDSRWVSIGINGFSNIAMTTSFLGVTLGLFDFIADGFKRSDTRFGRAQTSVITFIPPLIFALYFPEGFILALTYAAIFVTILEVILPVLMVYKLRYVKNSSEQLYQVFGGKSLLFVVLVCGIALIVLQILISLHMLPALG